MKNTTKLWSKRYSDAKGSHWQFERDCIVSDAASWRDVFEKDEPAVLFLLSDRRPSK